MCLYAIIFRKKFSCLLHLRLCIIYIEIITVFFYRSFFRLFPVLSCLLLLSLLIFCYFLFFSFFFVCFSSLSFFLLLAFSLFVCSLSLFPSARICFPISLPPRRMIPRVNSCRVW